jgi:hypothetical protein
LPGAPCGCDAIVRKAIESATGSSGAERSQAFTVKIRLL